MTDPLPRYITHPNPVPCSGCGRLVAYSWPGQVCGQCRWDEFGRELLIERFRR